VRAFRDFRFGNLWQSLNTQQRRFIRVSLLWLVGWYVIDTWIPLDPTLTQIVVTLSARFIGLLQDAYPVVILSSEPFQGNTLQDAQTTMNIAHSCNGKAILFLFTAFLWAIPQQPMVKRINYTLIGFILLSLANALRITALFIISKHMPEWFGFFHHTLFQLAMYAIMFTLWMFFLKKEDSSH
jgi:exosortase/archaeosortase family protein